jgi:DNA invertase Pin-like site-specific DNA recombinase
MRSGISITVNRAARLRLEGVVRDRNTAQKHVWRAAIVLLSADGAGTTEIMRRTGKSKTCVWRWQERFMEEGEPPRVYRRLQLLRRWSYDETDLSEIFT